MKKTIIFTLFIMIIAFTGCGMKKETELAKEEEVNNYVEEVVIEEPIVSNEYLDELDYNSQQNVYFGER